MQNQSSNNKRIIKNTLMLYIRMGILILVNLYTSRIILNALYNPQNQKSRFQKRKIKKTANDLLIAFIV